MDPAVLTEALDSLHEGIQILSADWRYLYVNASAARQGRKPREELLGKTMQECYPGIEKTPLFAVLARCLREQRAEKLDNEFTYEDAQRAWFELRIRPWRGGLVIASLDVTEQRNAELHLQDAYQRALRDLVTPVIRVHRGVLLVPLVGALDARRATDMTDAVLTRVQQENAKVVIFDIAGVPALDTAVANHLLQASAMLRLLGAKTVMTGIGAAASKTLVHLGVDLSTIETTSNLAGGLELALAHVGKTIADSA